VEGHRAKLSVASRFRCRPHSRGNGGIAQRIACWLAPPAHFRIEAGSGSCNAPVGAQRF